MRSRRGRTPKRGRTPNKGRLTKRTRNDRTPTGEQNYSGVGYDKSGKRDYSKKVAWKGANHQDST